VIPVVEARPNVDFPVTVSVPVTSALPLVVIFVAEAFPRVVCPTRYVFPDTVKFVDEALPKVEVPEVRVVIVALVAVRLVKNAVIAVKILVKKLDEVALVVEAFTAKRFVVVLLAVELFVLYIDTAVIPPVAVAFESVVCPVTDNVPVAVMLVAERLDVEALPKNEVAEVILVNTGFGDTSIVDVPENTILLEPALK
jgi:hypothetical protein